MKNLSCLLFIMVAISLPSCNSKTSAVIENASPNGKIKVRIEGKRTMAFDPFKTEISVKAYDFKEGKLIFEIMSGDLNKENVKFNWKDDNTCTITIEESDKNVRSFQLVADQSQVQLAEI